VERPFPPCQAACPVRTDTREYVNLIAWGRFEEALQVIRKVNPFPSVCGRICQHPCEAKCRRGTLDSAVALKELKRFVTEIETASDPVPEAPPVTRGKVAVVGAGPSGLTAAQDLRGMGYGVTVFERLARAGGMLNLIPRYRLPDRVLRKDVDAILARGIEVKCNCEIGRDVQLSDLQTDGYQAVIVCAGLSRSRGLALPGFGAERFVAAIPLMMDVWAGNPVPVGRKALVIGGGNVAVDVARTLRRLGAEQVTMACMESGAEIPASEEEVAAATEEGIRLMPAWAPKRVLKKDGHVAGLELMRVTRVFDEKRRFSPQYDPAHVKAVAADMVVLTIGQAGDTSWTGGSAVKLDRRGRIVADRELHSTSEPRVFLAGEVLNGPGSAIQAIADGRRAAAIVDQFLQTGVLKTPPPEDRAIVGEFPEAAREDLHRLDRPPMRQVPGPERIAGFQEHDLGYDETAALREAARCLNCGAGPAIDETKCASCLACFRLCPLDGVKIEKKMVAAPEACQACGLCAAECPQGAITIGHWTREQFREQIDRGLDSAKPARPRAAVVLCAHAAASKSELDALGAPDAAVVRLRVPCVTHLAALDLLRLIANGMEEIRVVLCSPAACKHASSQERAKQVLTAAVERARAVRPNATIEFVETQQVVSENLPVQGVRP